MYRVESAMPVSKERPCYRAWTVKVPSGLYETLTTNEKGRGLFICRITGKYPASPFQYTQLLGEEEFCVPEHATKFESMELLEVALDKLGWDQDFIVLLKG